MKGQKTVKQLWGRDISNSKHEERGALDIVLTKEPDAAFPDGQAIDIVYHNTDVSLAFYLAQGTNDFDQVLDEAEAYCQGYNKALKDIRKGQNSKRTSRKGDRIMNKGLLLEELDALKTYFEEVIDSVSEDGEAELDTMFMLNNLKEYVEDAIKYVKRR